MRIIIFLIISCVVLFRTLLSAQEMALIEPSRAEAIVASMGIRQLSAIVLHEVLANDGIAVKYDGVRELLAGFKGHPHALSAENVKVILGCVRRGEVDHRSAARLLIAFIFDGCGADTSLLNEVKAELSLSKYTRIVPDYTSTLLGSLADWETNQSSMNIVGFLSLNPDLRSKAIAAKTATSVIRARLGDVDSERDIIRAFEWRMSRNDDYRLDLDVSAATDLLIANTDKTREVYFETLRSNRMRTVLLPDASGQALHWGDVSIAYEMLIALGAMYPGSGLLPATEEERKGLDGVEKINAYKQRVEKKIYELEHEAIELKFQSIFVPKPELNQETNDIEIIKKP